MGHSLLRIWYSTVLFAQLTRVKEQRKLKSDRCAQVIFAKLIEDIAAVLSR